MEKGKRDKQFQESNKTRAVQHLFTFKKELKGQKNPSSFNTEYNELTKEAACTMWFVYYRSKQASVNKKITSKFLSSLLLFFTVLLLC